MVANKRKFINVRGVFTRSSGGDSVQALTSSTRDHLFDPCSFHMSFVVGNTVFVGFSRRYPVFHPAKSKLPKGLKT